MVPIKKQIAHLSNFGYARSLSNIKWIVIHYTANDGDSDENNALYFQRNIVKSSAHYFVDDDSITQSVPDNYVAYAVGGSKLNSYGKYHGICTNSNSISIEICDNVRNGVIYPTQKTINNALDLTQMLMTKYNIDISHVIRHKDVTGKVCPAYWSDDQKFNKEFISLLNYNPRNYRGLDYSPVFNAEFYANHYKDLKNAFGYSEADLFKHLITYGMNERRQASATFNPVIYAQRYEDLRKAFGDAAHKYYEHYIAFGIKEGRQAV